MLRFSYRSLFVFEFFRKVIHECIVRKCLGKVFLKIFFRLNACIYRRLCYTFVTMKVEIDNLKGVGNYAKKIKRNRSRVYQLINEGKLDIVKIDGVTFILNKEK